MTTPAPVRRRLGLMVAAVLLACLSPGGPILAAEASDAATPADTAPMAAADVIGLLAGGGALDLHGATIQGDLDLAALDTVVRPFRCTSCRFDGSLTGANVVFDRAVDLSGATVRGTVDFQGAVFRDTFLLRTTDAATAAIGGDASFALAQFDGRSSFDGVRFGGTADFRVAQFAGDTSFADAVFGGAARFDSAIFGAGARFMSRSTGTGEFAAEATFDGASFAGKADFRQQTFTGPASFEGAAFASADFTSVTFVDAVSFDDASFAADASFRIVSCWSDLSFTNVVLHGPTDFEAAVLWGEAQFHGTSATDELSLAGLGPGAVLRLDELDAEDLRMDLEALERVPGVGVQERVLEQIEVAARDREDLTLANAALFRRSQLETARAEGLDRLGRLASEQVAGYLVDPLYPLRALLLLLLLGTGVRMVVRVSPGFAGRRGAWELSTAMARAAGAAGAADSRNVPLSEPGGDPAERRLLRASKTAVVGLGAFADTLRAAVRLKPRDVPEGRREELPAYVAAFLAGAEWLAFKVLLGLVLVCLANGYPAFKQLVETVS